MDTWLVIGRIDSLLGILTVLLSGYAAYRLWRQNQDSRRMAREGRKSVNIQQLIRDYEGARSTKPIALAITLLPNVPTIKHDVAHYLQVKEMQMPIEEIKLKGIHDENDLEKYVAQLQLKKRTIQAAGFTELHLFIAGPVAAGVIAGGLYDNWLPVKLYHKPTPSPPSIYEYWMPLIGS